MLAKLACASSSHGYGARCPPVASSIVPLTESELIGRMQLKQSVWPSDSAPKPPTPPIAALTTDPTGRRR